MAIRFLSVIALTRADSEEALRGYKKYPSYGCDGRNELGGHKLPIEACKAMCDSNSKCISFEYNVQSTAYFKSNFCWLSTSCTETHFVSSAVTVYMKECRLYQCPSGLYNKNPAFTNYNKASCCGAHSGSRCPRGKHRAMLCEERSGRRRSAAMQLDEPEGAQAEKEHKEAKSTRLLNNEVARADSGEVLQLYEDQPGYAKYKGFGCSYRNELGTHNSGLSLAVCKAMCDSNSKCISFEFSSSTCALSTSCNEAHFGSFSVTVFVKKCGLYQCPSGLYNRNAASTNYNKANCCSANQGFSCPAGWRRTMSCRRNRRRSAAMQLDESQGAHPEQKHREAKSTRLLDNKVFGFIAAAVGSVVTLAIMSFDKEKKLAEPLLAAAA